MVSSSKIKAMELNRKSFLEIWTNSKTGYISIALSAATTQQCTVLQKLPRSWKYLNDFLCKFKSTGCGSLNENPTKFKIVKEPLLIQK